MTHLLIVKDERLLCDLLATTFAEAGFSVVKAHSGAEGIRRFRETRPQLTILDLLLPDMSGVSVLREFRYVDGSAPVIMLGGTGSSLLEEEARKLGVIDCLHKNLDLETLVQSVRDTLGEPSTDAAPSRSVFADRTRGARILIVDDDPQVRKLINSFLTREPEGYRVSMAEHGYEALEKIAADPPDLILLDLLMPRMNGIDVLRHLGKASSRIGVIAMSGAGDQGLVKSAMKLGSFDYVSKPINLAQLGVSIRAKLVLMRRRPA